MTALLINHPAAERQIDCLIEFLSDLIFLRTSYATNHKYYLTFFFANPLDINSIRTAPFVPVFYCDSRHEHFKVYLQVWVLAVSGSTKMLA